MEGSAAIESDKRPRTERGRRTLRKLLDAAVEEFGEKGFHDGSISGITRRAGVALGSFYTYFDSKDAIFRAVVQDFSGRVRDEARGAQHDGLTPPEIERNVLAAFLAFAREHKEIYRIIDEAEFADPASYRAHYENAAERIAARLDEAVRDGLVTPGDNEVRAWAIMGANVFLGLRYGVWDERRPIGEITAAVEALLREGIAAR